MENESPVDDEQPERGPRDVAAAVDEVVDAANADGSAQFAVLAGKRTLAE